MLCVIMNYTDHLMSVSSSQAGLIIHQKLESIVHGKLLLRFPFQCLFKVICVSSKIVICFVLLKGEQRAMSTLKDELSQLAKNIIDLSGCIPEEAPCTSRFVLYNTSKQLSLGQNGVFRYTVIFLNHTSKTEGGVRW